MLDRRMALAPGCQLCLRSLAAWCDADELLEVDEPSGPDRACPCTLAIGGGVHAALFRVRSERGEDGGERRCSLVAYGLC